MIANSGVVIPGRIVRERRDTVGSVVISGFVILKCTKTARRIFAALGILKQGVKPIGRVGEPSGVGIERGISDRCVARARNIAVKRLIAYGGVQVATDMAIERITTN